MGSAATGIKGISMVGLPTAEQDRAIEFYESIGFDKRRDTPFGDVYRWIELYPPEGTTGIALAPPPPGSSEVTPTMTGLIITTDDIDATHAAFKELGVDVDAEILRMDGPVPPLFLFRDPSGHTLLVVQSE